jgi:hypothetical protein
VQKYYFFTVLRNLSSLCYHIALFIFGLLTVNLKLTYEVN